jgi:3-hydroxyacyl-[acyl-carrier-protein] dehydratase
MEQKPHYQLGPKEIMAYLPHRYPFLLVDRILEISGPNPMDDENTKNKIGIKVVGLKNVTFSEPQFTGHFPTSPVMPGVLLIEAMAQTCSFSLYPYAQPRKKEGEIFQCILVGVDNARFRALVTPGDSLRIETEVTGCRTSLWTFECKAYVEGKLVAEAKIMANLIPSSQKQVI